MDYDLFGEESDAGSEASGHSQPQQQQQQQQQQQVYGQDQAQRRHVGGKSVMAATAAGAAAAAAGGANGTYSDDDQDNDQDHDNLFGDESDEEAEPADAVTRSRVEAYREGDQDNEEDEADYDLQGQDDREAARREIVVETALPSVGGPSPANNHNLYIVKLPNFLNIEPTPYDRSTYTDLNANNADDDEGADERIRLHVENTIRWRYDTHQTAPEAKDSNARLVRWSDNTFSLLLGDELFEVAENDLPDQHQYLAVDHPREGFLQTRAKFNRVMSFRPHSTQSLTHKKLTMAIASKHKKIGRTKLFTTTEDPEKQKAQYEKAENERHKARKRLEGKRNAKDTRMSSGRSSYGGGAGGYGGGGRGGRQGYDDYSDDDDDHYRSGNRNILDSVGSKRFDDSYMDDEDEGFVVDDDDEDDDDDIAEQRRASRLLQAKRTAPDGGSLSRVRGRSPDATDEDRRGKPSYAGSAPNRSDAGDQGYADAEAARRKRNRVIEESDEDE
ncbi:Leo1-like protein-domain-containing protein [Entophlyctis helioformis]|nr:Leo1-like protein-domain-containing protein [Entophlyctis helioformis]